MLQIRGFFLVTVFEGAIWYTFGTRSSAVREFADDAPDFIVKMIIGEWGVTDWMVSIPSEIARKVAVATKKYYELIKNILCINNIIILCYFL